MLLFGRLMALALCSGPPVEAEMLSFTRKVPRVVEKSGLYFFTPENARRVCNHPIFMLWTGPPMVDIFFTR